MASKKKLYLTQIANPQCDLSKPLSDDNNPRFVYRVTKVVNSVTPKLHDTLSVLLVADYCGHADWDVTVEVGRE